MTDKTNQTDTESTLQDEVLQTEGESPVEEWQGELPPDDDFHDQGDFQEELQDEIVEESLAAQAYDDQQDQTDVEQKKRGKGVLIGALAVGAIFIGGLAYLQFGVGAETDSTNPLIPVSSILDVEDIKNQKPQDMASLVAAELDKKAQEPIDPSKFFDGTRSAATDEMKVLPGREPTELVTDKPMESMSSEVVSTTAAALPPMSATEAALPPRGGKTAQGAAVTLPPPALESGAQVAKVETIPMPQAVKDTIKEAKPADAVSPDVERHLKELTAQVDTLKKSLDEVTKRNTTLLAEVEALHKAEAKQQAATVKAAKEEKTASVALDEPMLSGQDPAVTQPKAAAAKEAPKKPKAKASKPAPQKAVSKAPAAAWVLRAATPDAAWVAPSADSSELRRIAVGETLSGIGKVKEIRQSGDAWEVVGSSATLR